MCAFGGVEQLGRPTIRPGRERERESPPRSLGAQLAYTRNDNGVAAECFQFVFCESDTPGRFGQPDKIEALR